MSCEHRYWCCMNLCLCPALFIESHSDDSMILQLDFFSPICQIKTSRSWTELSPEDLQQTVCRVFEDETSATELDVVLPSSFDTVFSNLLFLDGKLLAEKMS